MTLIFRRFLSVANRLKLLRMSSTTWGAPPSSGAVQIGNPIMEKKVLDVQLMARDGGLYTAVTDCGAGGLSSAVGEMGEEAECTSYLAECAKLQGYDLLTRFGSEEYLGTATALGLLKELGPVVTALLFSIGRYGIAAYLAYTATASTYGAAGSVAQASDNVLIYATSNRRHLLPEYMKENLTYQHTEDGEVHPGEVIEEKISLSERFGLWISFYPFSQDEYLAIVAQWLRNFGVAEARTTNYVVDAAGRRIREIDVGFIDYGAS